ncbi:RNA polymerase sigma factor [Streptomyces brevispora]|uniref:RNA polymerase sigma factor n=1 Tax=Streptomyces brevispora TaxID=887462 RepID=UPI002E36E5B6|nr:sigma-70 family RNA polymerase sigma factor [Streptomyces brevispora]
MRRRTPSIWRWPTTRGVSAQGSCSPGVPASPGAWLVTTARNRAIDRIRREHTLAEKIHLLPAPEAVMDEFDDTVIKDERLELIFTCRPPALPLEGQVALTLRALGGLETAEIARAFLVSEETRKRRLSRAKTKIRATGIPFAVPGAHLLPDCLDAVLAVIYLICNEGYRDRADLGAEAIRLGRVLAALMPDEPEAHALLTLMMIHHARWRARFSGEDLVLLDDQHRSLWDTRRIAEGRVVLDRALPRRSTGVTSASASRWTASAAWSARRCRSASESRTSRRSDLPPDTTPHAGRHVPAATSGNHPNVHVAPR